MKQIKKVILLLIFTFYQFGCATIDQELDIHGQVVDAETKQPIPNVIIGFKKFHVGFPMGSWEIFESVKSDAEGRFNTKITANDDIDVEISISNPWVYLKYKDFIGKHKVNILILGSEKPKDMDGYENTVTYE